MINNVTDTNPNWQAEELNSGLPRTTPAGAQNGTFIQTQNKPHHSSRPPEISKYAKFHRNTLQTHENMEPKPCHFYKESYAKGQSLFP